MLISTMYHNINSNAFSNSLDIFEKHLQYIKNNFNIVLPGDKLDVYKKNICLTFDDAFFNFYYYVFPLLQKYNMKVILAVPTKFILDTTKLKDKQRLSFNHHDTYNNIDKAPFCTFEELQIMSNSGLVKIASHSHSHINLQTCKDLDTELQKSKNILENKLAIICDCFIFPFGKYNANVVLQSKNHYKYLFRIGNGINKNFDGINGLIYRINADGMKTSKSLFSKFNIFKFKIKSYIKSQTKEYN